MCCGGRHFSALLLLTRDAHYDAAGDDAMMLVGLILSVGI